MKKTSLLISFIMGISLLFMGFTNENIVKDFASFDKAFIPPLALTNQGKLNPSKKAMNILNQSWNSFKAKYYESNPKDANWKSDFDSIEIAIMEANGIVDKGGDLMPAHETLEEIRIITMDLRKRNNINYYIDPLTEFHSVMETIVHTASDNEPEDIDKAVIEEISEALAEAKTLWAGLGKFPFNKDAYDLNEKKAGAIKKLYKVEKEALNKLTKAIESGDISAIIAASKGVKPNYAKLYMQFGDFDSVTN